MGNYKTLMNKRMNFFQRIIFRIMFYFSPQVTVIRKRAMDYAVLTRENSRDDWKFRELMKGKHPDQAVKLVRVKYPNYLLYIPKAAFRKAASAQNESIRNKTKEESQMIDY